MKICRGKSYSVLAQINPLNADLNPICHLLALLGAHHILHVSRIRVKTLLHTYCETLWYFESCYLAKVHVISWIISIAGQLFKHCNWIQVGDPEELAALDQVFCKGRQTPLLIGSVKSNMGHSEPASGLCSVVKVLIAMEHGLIPPNLYFSNPRQDVEGLLVGRFKVHIILEW